MSSMSEIPDNPMPDTESVAERAERLLAAATPGHTIIIKQDRSDNRPRIEIECTWGTDDPERPCRTIECMECLGDAYDECLTDHGATLGPGCGVKEWFYADDESVVIQGLEVRVPVADVTFDEGWTLTAAPVAALLKERTELEGENECLSDKADLWEMAQPMIAEMGEVVAAAREWAAESKANWPIKDHVVTTPPLDSAERKVIAALAALDAKEHDSEGDQ